MHCKYSICFMPIIKSAKKNETKLCRKIRNNRRRANHDVLKEFYSLIAANDATKANTQLLWCTNLDLAAKNNIIPANRAARMKSKARKLSSLSK